MEQTLAGADGTPGTPVLVAEDHPATRKLLETILNNAGFAVTVAANGEEALDLFRRDFTPVVLMDWVMPELNGIQLCKALRHNAAQGYVYIIFLTAKDSKEDVVKALEAGADDYITKPFHREELLARIKTGLRILDLERSLKKANEEIKILSLTDPLTGIYNRGYLNDQLPHEIKRSVRYGHPLHVILCDIDHFKAVNDTYGHQAGDDVLKGFASLLKGSIRQNLDWAARYGGEEFVLVLPETDAGGACAVAERLRRGAEQERFRTQGRAIHITASWGISGFDPKDVGETLSGDFLLQEADRCLLKAKQDGRNRVVFEARRRERTRGRRKKSYG
ncbi:MAG: diguanylate cyclase [Desulfobacterota bacterium]|jgi:diguanylate cyclase (GGDEF)-like protein|nr:diguanylate cyclase [Thermodesulfobacteriota bacterium]